MKSAAIIFAILSGRPVILEYKGNLAIDIAPWAAKQISWDEAERRLRDEKPPVLFAMAGGPVVRGTRKDGVALLAAWRKVTTVAEAKKALNHAGRRAKARAWAAKNR